MNKYVKEMLDFNEGFVARKEYERYQTSKYPDRKVAILTCMDTRLVGLLPAALNIKNGDVKMIKNAGGVVLDPFDSAIRSLLVGIIELGVEEVMVIGHTDCGVSGISEEIMVEELIKRGVSEHDIEMMRYSNIDLANWLKGFSNLEGSVTETVNILRNHPLIPKDVTIDGYVIDTVTGKVTPVECKTKKYERA